MKIKPDEITSILKSRIEGLDEGGADLSRLRIDGLGVGGEADWRRREQGEREGGEGRCLMAEHEFSWFC